MIGLLLERAFRPLAVAFVLGEAIEWLALVGLAFVVFDETGSALAATALFLASRLAPSFFVPIATAKMERWASRRGMGLIMAAEACVFGALALSLSTFSLALVCALAFVDGCLASTVRALTRAAVSHTLEPLGKLRDGNALLNVGFAVMNVAGPGVAGLILVATSASTTLFVGGGLLLVTSAYLVSSNATTPVPAVGAGGVGRRLRELFDYLRENRRASGLLAGESVVLMFGTLVAPLEVVLAVDALGAGPEGFPALAAGWGVGLTAGSLVYARVGRKHLRVSLISSTAAMGVGILAMGFAPTLLAACVAAAIGGCGNGIQWVSAVTALQESVRPDMQLRVSGLLESSLTFVPGVGFLIGGALAEVLSPRAAFIAAGGAIVVCSIAAAIASAWHRQAVSPAQ